MYRLPLRGSDRHILLHVLVDVEHQSSVDPNMAARCFQYAGLITGDALDMHPGQPPPPVISAVVYTGAAKWTAPTTMLEAYALGPDQAERMKTSFYHGGYALRDLQAASVQELLAMPWPAQMKITYLGLKQEATMTTGDYDTNMVQLTVLYEQYLPLALAEPRGGREELARNFTWLNASTRIKPEDVEKLYMKVGYNALGEPMTMTDLLEAKGAAEQTLKLLRHKFGNLPQGTVERVMAASPEELDTWGYRMIDVSELKDVFR